MEDYDRGPEFSPLTASLPAQRSKNQRQPWTLRVRPGVLRKKVPFRRSGAARGIRRRKKNRRAHSRQGESRRRDAAAARHPSRVPRNNAAIKGKIDEVLVKLPEPARKKLEEIEKTTGQPKSLLAGGGALFGLFLVFFLCPPQLVFSAVGVGYPTYASLKMLAEDKTEDAAMWITYWCLFSLLKVVMNPLDFILGFLPFYFYLKLVLLVWLFSPTTKGAGVVYEKVVKPFVFPLLVGSKSD